MRSFVNLRPLKAEFIGFRYIDSCSVVQPSKERCPHGIWLTTAARRSIFVVKKRVSSQHRHLVATGRVIKAPKKITLFSKQILKRGDSVGESDFRFLTFTDIFSLYA